MTPHLWLILFLITSIAAPASAGDDKARYLQENRLLEEELQLAQKQNLYIVFNLGEKTASLRAKGIRLRDLPLKKARYWGSAASLRSYHMEKKSTFIEPGRETIKPGENKDADTFDVEALELTDMPSRYDLYFDGGLTVFVRPQTDGVVSAMGNTLYAAKVFITRPFSLLWNSVRKKTYTALDIVLDGNDARTLYWSLTAGSGALIYPP